MPTYTLENMVQESLKKRNMVQNNYMWIKQTCPLIIHPVRSYSISLSLCPKRSSRGSGSSEAAFPYFSIILSLVSDFNFSFLILKLLYSNSAWDGAACMWMSCPFSKASQAWRLSCLNSRACPLSLFWLSPCVTVNHGNNINYKSEWPNDMASQGLVWCRAFVDPYYAILTT